MTKVEYIPVCVSCAFIIIYLLSLNWHFIAYIVFNPVFSISHFIKALFMSLKLSQKHLTNYIVFHYVNMSYII